VVDWGTGSLRPPGDRPTSPLPTTRPGPDGRQDEQGSVMTEQHVERARVRLPGISPGAYEHPVDKGALAVLRAVPGVAEVLKTVAGAFPERGERLMALASCIRV